ncbi:hypothetical protein ILYODFUR_004943 [Ilyodon furcidens]|uniref:Uncharacterized protein n=1 Tax=Ilyodon furcidens TaxID=33524 RepID=A0ABV0U424_9TELE
MYIDPSLNRHLNVVEGFDCWNNPRGYVVRGLSAPGRVSHGKQALGDGSDKERFRHLHEDHLNEARNAAQYNGARVPPWSQAWRWDSSASAWWPGYSLRDLARPSPNKRHKAIAQWAHHLHGEP